MARTKRPQELARIQAERDAQRANRGETSRLRKMSKPTATGSGESSRQKRTTHPVEQGSSDQAPSPKRSKRLPDDQNPVASTAETTKDVVIETSRDVVTEMTRVTAPVVGPITHIAEMEAGTSTPPPAGPRTWTHLSSQLRSPEDTSFMGWDPARVNRLSRLSPLMPELKDYYCSPTLRKIPGLPEYVQKACETPIRAWTTELEEATKGPTTLETMRLGLVRHGQSLVLLEKAYSKSAQFHAKHVKLFTSFQEKVGELTRAHDEIKLMQEQVSSAQAEARKAQEDARLAQEDARQAREELRLVRDELNCNREEVASIRRVQDELNVELQKLRTGIEVVECKKSLLAQQLLTAEETNTRLGLENSKLRTKEYVDSMSNFSYICVFANVIRSARQTLTADQITLLVAHLEKYLIDNPPDRNIPISDLSDLCDFSNLPDGIEIDDPILDEEDDDVEGSPAQPRQVKHGADQVQNEQDGPSGAEQRVPVDEPVIENAIERNAPEGTEQMMQGMLDQSLPPTPNNEFVP